MIPGCTRRQNDAFRLTLIGLVFACILLPSLSWSACTTRWQQETLSYTNDSRCSTVEPWRCGFQGGSGEYCGTGNRSYCKPSATTHCDCYVISRNCNPVGQASDVTGGCMTYSCSTASERDSVECVLGGELWNNGACQPPFDSVTACADDKQQCQSLGGSWKYLGEVDGECSSVCDLCGSAAQTKVQNEVAKACCSQNKAPPDSVVQCSTPLQSGPGMTSSVFADKSNSYGCGQLTDADGGVIAENAALYKKFCIDGEQYEETPQSSGSGTSGSEGSSSSEETNSSFGTELEALGGLYGVLDTIRDTLVKRLTPATEQILTCLQNAGLCPGLGGGGDTTIVNIAGDSAALRVDTTLRQTIKPLMQEGLQNDTLNRIIMTMIADKTDSLIDSSRKYLKRVADSVGAVNKSVESLPGNIAKSLDSGIMAGYNSVDTSGTSYSWIQDGESLADSVLGGSGYSGLDFAGDSAMRDSLEALGYVCDDSSCCVGSECIEFDSDQSIQDSISHMVSRMADTIHQKNSDFYNDSVTNMFQEVKDSLTAFNPLGIFDSTIMSTLGATIPNSNVCPDHCSTFQVNIPFLFGTQTVTIDWGLCMGRAVFGDGNVMSFLRFIIRIIVAVTCITAVMWNATRIRR